MQRRTTLIFVFLLTGWTFAMAQNITVKGTIKDQKGGTLPGVSVRIKDSTTGVLAGANGDYSISVPGNATLIFTYLGFTTHEEAVNNRNVIDITLVEENRQLSEVVVIGYGTQRKGDITGSVGIVSEEAFESRPNTQFGSIIQGKTAGVQVLSSSGKPSSGFSMRIRGTSSINASSEPLYVVDGVPTADTRSLSPSDIETITVLKDASSAAIYGAQGANGVVLITTKQGKMGDAKFEFDAYAGFSSVWKELDVLNGEQYKTLMTEMGQNTD